MVGRGPLSTAVSFSAGPMVRIRFPPAESLETFGCRDQMSAGCARNTTRRPMKSIAEDRGTDSSNPCSSSGESDETARLHRPCQGNRLAGERGGQGSGGCRLFLRLWEAHRAARKEAGRVVGPGPSFIALDKLDGTDGVGSGLAEKFQPIAQIKLAGQSADRPPLSAHDIEVIDGIDRLKRDVVDSAAKWLRFDPVRVKIDIHITIDA